MKYNDLAKMMTDGLITELEFQRLLQIDDFAERVVATREFLYTKQKMISAKLDDLYGLGEVVTDQPDVEDVIEENVLITPALLLTPVLNCLFRYLDVGDLKRCKGVCRQWREIAEVKLRKRSAATIVFPCPFSLLEFMTHYANCLPCKPFTSFSFLCTPNHDAEDLENFFNKFGKTIKQLAIVLVGYADSPFKFDFGPFLLPYIITKLHLKAVKGSDQELYLSLARFSSLKYLRAANYILHIEGLEKKLSLVDLTLEGVRFHNGRQIVSQLLVNEVFDLRIAENIVLLSRDEASISELSMDMSVEILNPKKILLLGVDCLNWARCSWQIEQFKLEGRGGVYS